ncbi:MAG TPA: hypothetical protein VM534_06645 [Thermoanaerobaculia bacterium]|nr:hypothetical protein [Thermoanaerobaculia bacterium]
MRVPLEISLLRRAFVPPVLLLVAFAGSSYVLEWIFPRQPFPADLLLVFLIATSFGLSVTAVFLPAPNDDRGGVRTPDHRAARCLAAVAGWICAAVLALMIRPSAAWVLMTPAAGETDLRLPISLWIAPAAVATAGGFAAAILGRSIGARLALTFLFSFVTPFVVLVALLDRFSAAATLPGIDVQVALAAPGMILLAVGWVAARLRSRLGSSWSRGALALGSLIAAVVAASAVIEWRERISVRVQGVRLSTDGARLAVLTAPAGRRITTLRIVEPSTRRVLFRASTTIGAMSWLDSSRLATVVMGASMIDRITGRVPMGGVQIRGRNGELRASLNLADVRNGGIVDPSRDPHVLVAGSRTCAIAKIGPGDQISVLSETPCDPGSLVSRMLDGRNLASLAGPAGVQLVEVATPPRRLGAPMKESGLPLLVFEQRLHRSHASVLAAIGRVPEQRERSSLSGVLAFLPTEKLVWGGRNRVMFIDPPHFVVERDGRTFLWRRVGSEWRLLSSHLLATRPKVREGIVPQPGTMTLLPDGSLLLLERETDEARLLRCDDGGCEVLLRDSTGGLLFRTARDGLSLAGWQPIRVVLVGGSTQSERWLLVRLGSRSTVSGPWRPLHREERRTALRVLPDGTITWLVQRRDGSAMLETLDALGDLSSIPLEIAELERKP